MWNRPFRLGEHLDAERTATRVSAYLYGDVLVLASLIALNPSDLTGTTGLAYVLGAALSTYLAHVLAEVVGLGIRGGEGSSKAVLRHELRDALPIASAASGPAVLMVAALLGWWTPGTALTLALGVTTARLAVLGWVIGYLRGEPPSPRTFLAGIVLALTGATIAALKWWLTH
jgi:small-conductance mechanosensitive channel